MGFDCSRGHLTTRCLQGNGVMGEGRDVPIMNHVADHFRNNGIQGPAVVVLSSLLCLAQRAGQCSGAPASSVGLTTVHEHGARSPIPGMAVPERKSGPCISWKAGPFLERLDSVLTTRLPSSVMYSHSQCVDSSPGPSHTAMRDALKTRQKATAASTSRATSFPARRRAVTATRGVAIRAPHTV